jgi:hypothetical protein
MTTKPPLQKILKGLLHTEDENKHNHKRMGSIKPHEKNRQALRVALNWLHTLKTTKWQESPHLSILTLNVKGLSSPFKKYHFTSWIKKEDPTNCFFTKRTILLTEINTA